MLGQAQVQTQVTHHRRDERVVLEFPGLGHPEREDRHDLVAPDDGAGGVDSEAAVGVAVVGEPERRAVLDDCALQALDVRRADALVDVVAVRIGVDRHDLGAGLRVRARGRLECGAVSAVDDDLESGQWVADRAEQVLEVRGERGLSVEAGDPADAVARRSGDARLESILDAVLELVGQLASAGCEEFDAVIGHRVVGRRDHRAQRGLVVPGEMRDRRRRHLSDEQHVDALRGETRSERRFEHLPRHARVAADHGERALPVPARFVAGVRGGVESEHRGGCRPERKGQVHGQRLIGKSADSVRSKHSGHGKWSLLVEDVRRARGADDVHRNEGLPENSKPGGIRAADALASLLPKRM